MYTAAQLYEVHVSSDSCAYYAANYLIRKPLSFNQLRWLDDQERKLDLGAERSTYRTSTMLAKSIWYAVKGYTVLYASHNHDATYQARNETARMLSMAPGYLLPVFSRNQREEIAFTTSGRILFRSIDARSVRGMRFDLAMIDNINNVHHQDYYEFDRALMPAIGLDGMVNRAY